MASKFIEANRFCLDGFLDTFGREFCKHDVLWRPEPNYKDFEIQSATHVAYRTLAQALNLSVEAVLELLKTFPAACLDLISRYDLRRKIDAGCRMPGWLTLLAGQSRFLKNVKFCLMQKLCESARVGLEPGVAGGPAGVTDNEPPPLRGPQAVAYFVSRHGVSEKDVLPAWRSMLEMCVVKQRAVLAAGDRLARLPAALRPTAAERVLADLALLHDARLSQITLLTPTKLRTLVLLFQLIVAAKETYDGGGTNVGGGAPGDQHSRYGVNGDDNILSRLDNIGGEDIYGRLDSAIEELSVECMKPRSARNLLRESFVERARQSDDDDYAPEEEFSDEELHKELDLEPEIHVISSDSSDCEISDKYIEKCSKDNIEVPVLVDEGRIEESGSDIMEKNNLSYRERESYISPKSQNSDTKSEYPTKCWYEESESNSSEERKAVWALVYTDFKKRGRSASLISLQHRWVELLHLARVALLTAWRSDALVDRNVHPLLLVVGHWFPEIVTETLPSWNSLVSERKIVLESDIKDIIHKYQENDNFLLNVTENLTFPDLLKKYVTNKKVIDPHGHTKSNATNKHLSYQIHKENTSSITNNTDKVLEQDSQAQDNDIINESNVNNCISTILDQIDPSKAKISIIIDEDSDEDAEDRNSTNYDNSVCHETKPYLNNLDVSKSERSATNLKEQYNHIPLALEKVNELTKITMKNIEKELEDKLNYITNTDKQTVSHDLGSQEESSSLRSYRSVIDEKLLNPVRIVITPIEHLPEWKKHSKNGVIKCRKFSVKNFMKPVTATSIQLSKCATNVYNNKNNSEECESENYMNNEVRIKFEDDTFETDFSCDDDINNGIKYQKYIELYNMPDHLRKNRMKLTRTLKLSRTYFSSNFWSLDSNIELMKLCKPMAIKLRKVIPRVAKRVELSDINEVRRINRSILTAQVLPTVGTPAPHAQRSSTSQEAANSTNNSMSSNSDSTRQTVDCLSRDLDSTELLNLLTNYVIQTNISKESVIESVRKDNTLNSNLMDSIIDTMRLADKNNSQHSTVTCALNSLQHNSLPSSDTSEMLLESNISKNISATYTFNTIQKSTEEVLNNLKLNSNNNSLLDVVMPNVGDMKDMILDLVERFDTKMRHEYSMKINRSNLNLHLKNFEKQMRGFVKNISKLTKILPQYYFNMKPKRRVTKNATAQIKRKKVNRIKWKESKDHSTIPSSNTENSTDIANNTNTVFVDDDCEPILVIDERSLEESDNICLNNLQCYEINTNKHIQKTCNIRKNDMKEKPIKKAKKRSRQPNKILEKEKPMLNEYEEWHRQKTMALKYFTIPMSDTSKQTSKVKITQQQSTTTSIEQQSNGSQTTIPINRNNTEDVATTSTEQQSNVRQTTLPINRKNTEDVTTTSTEHQSNGSQTTIPIIRKSTEDVATTSTEHQSNGSQTTIPIIRKSTEDIATTSTEQQSNGSQTTIPLKRKNTEDIATTSTEQQSNGSQTTIPIKRKNTEDVATTSTEQQSNGSQTTIPLKRKNTEDIATTSTEQQSNGSQTTIPIKRKSTEDIATTSTEQQSNGSQTTIPIKRKNTEDIATTSTEQQSNGSQTTIPIKRKNTEDIATTSTEQQSNGSQTTIPIIRKSTEDIATTSTEQQSNGSQTTIPIKRKNTEDIATTSTEHQSNGSQTTIPIKRKNTEDIATTSTEHQSNGSQTTIPLKRKNTEDIATTSTEQQSNGSQTTIPIKRKNTEDIATTSTEHQSNGSQTTIPLKRKNTEDIATTSTEQQSNGSQTTIPIKRKNTEDVATTSTEQQSYGSQTTIPIIRKSTEDIATTSTEQKSNGSQTTIPLKRKNTEDIATTSTASGITKRPKFPPNESNVIYISDSSSDYDEQISKFYIAQQADDNNPNSIRADIHQIDKTENANKVLIFNDTVQKQAVNQNVCVINAPVALSIQPAYIIIDDTQLPTATQDAINKTKDSETINNPAVFQVLSNATSFLTPTQIVSQSKTQQNQIVVMNEKCTLTNKCKCIKCENTLRDDILNCTLDLIQNPKDSINNQPSTSLKQESDHLDKKAITVKKYLSASKKLTALIKVDASQKLLVFCSKYIILTDVNIPNSNATYRVSIKIKNKQKLSRVLLPSDIKGSVLLLGPKNETDYIYCKCLKGKRLKCNLCQRIKDNLPNLTNLLKIDSDHYKRISQNPNKYVRLNENELKMNSRAELEGTPDLILVNKMFFKKLSDSPLMYVRILSATQDAATIRHLVRKDVLLYAFDVTRSRNCFSPLVYTRTSGHVTVNHSDNKLVKALQWIFN